MRKLLPQFFPRHLYRKEFVIFFFTFFYIIFFVVYSVLRSNYEFVLYSFALFLLLNLGIYIHRKVQLPEFIIVGLSLFGLMHVLGGNVLIGNTRLYEMFFFHGFIRYDNIVHFLGSFLACLVLNVLFFFFVERHKKIVLSLYYFALFLMTLGAGVVNEIVELIAVIFLGASDAVGDYYNNAVDLVFNSIGALLAILMIEIYHQYKDKKGHIISKIIHFLKGDHIE